MRSRYKKAGMYGGAVLLLALLTAVVYFSKGSASHTGLRPVSVSSQAVALPGGWGYKINVNQHLYIYQKQIPCLSGSQPFPSRQSAMAVARIVEQKIRDGESPSVSMKDLARVIPGFKQGPQENK